MRILVVEDEEDLAGAVAAGLRREGYAVDVAGDGQAALERLGVHAYDMVCLDLNLPDTDGLDICRHVVDTPRSEPDAADAPRILVLSARDRVEDRIAGLDHGADDYLVKPFALGELTARVRALLRRDSVSAGAVLRWDDIELDAARHVACIGGRPLDLTPKEFALLRFLLLHPDEVHSAERLLEHVWDEHADPFTNTVRVTISNLRRKLAEAGDRQPIGTVTGRGYRLVASGVTRRRGRLAVVLAVAVGPRRPHRRAGRRLVGRPGRGRADGRRHQGRSARRPGCHRASRRRRRLDCGRRRPARPRCDGRWAPSAWRWSRSPPWRGCWPAD